MQPVAPLQRLRNTANGLYISPRQIQSTPSHSEALMPIGAGVAQSISLLLHFFGMSGVWLPAGVF